jgi:hypothetical protein
VIEPLRLKVEVACDAAHAFAIWTARFGTWWPRGHTISGDPDAIVLEPRPGGRIFERARDGTEIDWGEIVRWEPPAGLSYLWHIRRDRSQATEVAIAFVEAGPGRCLLEIVQTGWERLGDEGASWRDANTQGWNGLLPHFATAVESRGKEE